MTKRKQQPRYAVWHKALSDDDKTMLFELQETFDNWKLGAHFTEFITRYMK